MGRSGGGGGGFSGGGGGFSGGGRSSGGFSGGSHSGGRSGGGNFGGGRPGGWGAPPPPPRSPYRNGPIIIDNSRRYYGGGGNGGGNGNGQNNSGGSGCGTTLVILVLVVLLFCGIGFFFSDGSGGSITASTVAREALPANAVTETGYYTDADGDWIHNESELVSGLKQFYRETGVQPYVYILPNGESTSVPDLKSRAEALYPQLFTDEAHFLLVFCDDGRGGYNCGYTVGSQAKTVMDNEAVSILADYLDPLLQRQFGQRRGDFLERLRKNRQAHHDDNQIARGSHRGQLRGGRCYRAHHLCRPEAPRGQGAPAAGGRKDVEHPARELRHR